MSALPLVSNLFRDGDRRRASRRRMPARARLAVEALAERLLPAVTATFSAVDANLVVAGDEQANNIVVSRTAAGTILVNGGAVVIQGGPATVANTRTITIVGAGGNDNLSLNETNGALPLAVIGGGEGDDVLTGGSGNDLFSGGAGNDMAFLGAGADIFLWNPGDGSDLVEGQGGVGDTLVFNGSGFAERFDVSAIGTRIRLTSDLGGVTMDVNGVEVINLNASGGADTITVHDTSATNLNQLNLDLGGAAGHVNGLADAVILNGTDRGEVVQITGTLNPSIVVVAGFFPFVTITSTLNTLDTLQVNTLGGNDSVDASGLFATNAQQLVRLTVNGGAGDDILTGSPGIDTFVWNPGDGHDTIDAGDSAPSGDNLVFNGSELAERFVVSANGTRVLVTRDVDGGSVNLSGVENIAVNALAGADFVTVNDLTGTDIMRINLDLAATTGGATGDGQADTVIFNGSNRDERIDVSGSLIGVNSGSVFVNGDTYFMTIRATEGSSDNLLVNALGGNDTVDALNLFATNATVLIKLTIIGGTGNDSLIGSEGPDTFLWFAGDGNDTVGGNSGDDRIIFDGSSLAERFVLSANGNRARFTRDLDGAVVDVGNVETITIDAFGGADTVTVNDLTGTPVTRIGLNLTAALGSPAGDGAADSVIVNGRNAADFIPISGNNQVIVVDGGTNVPVGGRLPYVTSIISAELNDTLTVNALGGDDVVDASALFPTNGAQLIRLTVSGGAGNDALLGSPGADVFVWNPGDGSDAIAGQGGLDALTFNGSDLAENFVVSRNGGGIRLTNDLGAVAMDLNTVELIALNAHGGADAITVGDLTETGIIILNLDLTGPAGGGDGQADSVVVNGTNGDDCIRVSSSGLNVVVEGLVPTIRIDGSDGTTDRLRINALGGNDAVDSTGLPAGLIGLTVDLGDGQTPAPRVTGVVVNGGAAQRSLVTQIRIAFDQHVQFIGNPADAFRLVRQSDGAAVLVSAAVDDTGPGTIVTLTFVGGAVEGVSLADGRYTLTVQATKVFGPGVNGGQLDGDGNGTGGDNFVLPGNSATNPVFRLFGDVNGDAAVNGLDLTAFRNAFGSVATDATYLSFLDANGDGAINGLDLGQFRSRFGTIV